MKMSNVIIGLLSLSVFVLFNACVESKANNESNNELGEEYTIYKLYKERSKEAANRTEGIAMFTEFRKFYDANDVKVIGVWKNINDDKEMYFMTAFHDEAHYKKFVETVKMDEKYNELNAKIVEGRESIDVTTLEMVVDL